MQEYFILFYYFIDRPIIRMRFYIFNNNLSSIATLCIHNYVKRLRAMILIQALYK